MYDWSGAEFEVAASALFKHVEKIVNERDPEPCQNKSQTPQMSRLYKAKARAFRDTHRTDMPQAARFSDIDTSGVYAVKGLKTCICGKPHDTAGVAAPTKDADAVLSAEYVRFFVNMPPPTAEGNAYMGIGLPCVYKTTPGGKPGDLVIEDYANLIGAQSKTPATKSSVQPEKARPEGGAKADKKRGGKKENAKDKGVQK